eukprot:CAMPEP_0170304988 /NCGR_PEP_ID=MMETSP0116_2-20130129/52850_1 /TAXON_ID=400756 /ORGANISM="Durinskia baltica, Strain CSIRO CS-38" /LENGTH=244 /DNA_ID=CAMNT_0010557003 /DNA_START=408 /DNA_END=1141 /DNA_ORIENTATION=+
MPAMTAPSALGVQEPADLPILGEGTAAWQGHFAWAAKVARADTEARSATKHSPSVAGLFVRALGAQRIQFSACLPPAIRCCGAALPIVRRLATNAVEALGSPRSRRGRQVVGAGASDSGPGAVPCCVVCRGGASPNNRCNVSAVGRPAAIGGASNEAGNGFALIAPLHSVGTGCGTVNNPCRLAIDAVPVSLGPATLIPSTHRSGANNNKAAQVKAVKPAAAEGRNEHDLSMLPWLAACGDGCK